MVLDSAAFGAALFLAPSVLAAGANKPASAPRLSPRGPVSPPPNLGPKVRPPVSAGPALARRGAELHERPFEELHLQKPLDEASRQKIQKLRDRALRAQALEALQEIEARRKALENIDKTRLPERAERDGIDARLGSKAIGPGAGVDADQLAREALLGRGGPFSSNPDDHIGSTDGGVGNLDFGPGTAEAALGAPSPDGKASETVVTTDGGEVTRTWSVTEEVDDGSGRILSEVQIDHEDGSGESRGPSSPAKARSSTSNTSAGVPTAKSSSTTRWSI